MPPATSSSVTTASATSSSDISLPSSPSPSPEPSADPYAFYSSDEADAGPPAKKKLRYRVGTEVKPRSWPTADEVVLLEAVAAHKEQHGRLPRRADLAAALGGRLPHVTAEKAALRARLLRKRYHWSVRRLGRGTVPVTDDDVRVFRLSKRIWGAMPKRAARRRPRAAPHHERREFAELEGLYPCLAAVVEAVDAKHGATGMMKLAFGRIGDEQAAELEAKVERQRLAQLKMEARRAQLTNLVARTFLGAMDME